MSSRPAPILHRWILPALSGVLYFTAFPPFDLSLLAWFAFVPLLVALRDAGPREAFWRGWISGWIAYTGVIYWVTVSMARYGGMPWAATVPPLLLLSAYMGLFTAVFSAGLAWIRSARPVPAILLAPVLWTALEYVRGHALTGFPWGLIGYSQYRNLPLIQIADAAGVYGVSFLVLWVNASLAEAVQSIRTRSWRPVAAAVSAAAIAVVLAWAYGHQRMAALDRADARPLSVSVVQANIPQDVKWDLAFRQYSMDRYADLTRRAAGPDTDLIVWPEAAMPFIFEDETFFREQVLSLVRETGIPLLFGSPGRSGGDSRRAALTNSAFLIDGHGRTIGRQDKIHLVPFGEYVPLSRLLFFVNKMVEGIGDFEAGSAAEVLKLPVKSGPPARLGVVICFEVIFPELVREFVKGGAEAMVTITNDAWFGRSSAPYQHFSMTVFRAVENRVPFVRAANTGISGFIDAEGRIRDASGIFTEATLSRSIRVTGVRSLYSRIGDIFAAACVIMAAAAAGLRVRARGATRRKRSDD